MAIFESKGVQFLSAPTEKLYTNNEIVNFLVTLYAWFNLTEYSFFEC
jgi:hypothetical protein